MQTFYIDDPVFKEAPLFVIGCTLRQLETYLRPFNCATAADAGQAGQMYTFTCAPWRVVWVRNKPNTHDRLGILVHEVFHLVTRICQDKGIDIQAQTERGIGDETAAYLLDYFVREALRRTRVKLG